jgi:MarR family transcriptional regulator, lower aerobic nicotinate degradation pathway regulator
MTMLFGDASPPTALGDYTGFLMNWCAARSRGAFADALEELGLRPPQFAVLSVIDGNPGLTQQALVEATGIDPSTMVQLLDSLAAAGWAERRPHATDRRKRAVHLTPEGAAVLARAREAATRVGEATFAPLAPEEREQLHALLRKLAGLDPA